MRPLASSARTAPPTKKIICCKSSRAQFCRTNNIDHHRTADFPALAAALAGKPEATASMRDVFNAPAILLIGNDPTEQHPLLAWQIRNNVRLHRAQALRHQLAGHQVASPSDQLHSDSLRTRKVSSQHSSRRCSGRILTTALPRIAESARQIARRDRTWSSSSDQKFAARVRSLVKFASGIQGAKFLCLGDYANSRGAADMGLYPDLLPGYHPVADSDKFHAGVGRAFRRPPG